MILNTKGKTEMKLSKFIEQYGDCEVTEEMEKCIIKNYKSIWNLKYNDTCYCLDEFNNIFSTKWDNSIFLKKKREIGLVTLTEEELEFKRESMKVYEELKRFAKDFTDEEWKNADIIKYFIYYDYDDESIYFDRQYIHKKCDLFFEDAKKMEEAIEAVGEERVKKYYLGVGK